jgi:hypothetical protein
MSKAGFANVGYPMRAVELQDAMATVKCAADDVTAMPVSVRVLRSVSEVEEIRGTWMQMQRNPNADIDFFLTVLRTRPQILRPHIILCYRDGIPEAMLVGRLENGHVDLKIGYADFLRPRARMLIFIHGGLLGNPGSDTCEILVREVMKSLRLGEADIAFFNHLRADSPLYVSLACQPGVLNRDYFPALQIHRSMTMPASAEEFWLRLSPKVRKNQRWQAKKLLTDHTGRVRINCFRETSELELMFQDVEKVAKKTYQRGLGVGFVDSSEVRMFLHLKAEKEWLRTYVLYVADRPCAFWSGTLYRGEFHSDCMGYDPEYGKYSPGMYLITRVIEDFCKQDGAGRVAGIDFGLGDAQYKEILGDISWEDASVYMFGPTLRGAGLNAFRTPIMFVERICRKTLERTNLTQKVKRLWRLHRRKE